MEDILGTSHIYCLCLKGSEREEPTKKSIINAGFSSLKMLYGIKGKDLTIKQLEQYTTPRAFRTTFYKRTRVGHEDLQSLGAIGCALGHIYFWELVVKNEWKRAIFFEDDIVFTQDFQRYIKGTFNELERIDPDWEMFNFGYVNLNDNFQKTVANSNYLYKGSRIFVGAGAYMITLKGAKKLLKDALPLDVHIDAYMGLLADKSRSDPLRLYFSKQSLAYQELAMPSQIQQGLFDENLKILFPNDIFSQIICLSCGLVILYLIYKWGKRCERNKIEKNSKRNQNNKLKKNNKS